MDIGRRCARLRSLNYDAGQTPIESLWKDQTNKITTCESQFVRYFFAIVVIVVYKRGDLVALSVIKQLFLILYSILGILMQASRFPPCRDSFEDPRRGSVQILIREEI